MNEDTTAVDITSICAYCGKKKINCVCFSTATGDAINIITTDIK